MCFLHIDRAWECLALKSTATGLLMMMLKRGNHMIYAAWKGSKMPWHKKFKQASAAAF